MKYKILIPAVLLWTGLIFVPLAIAQSEESADADKSSAQADAAKTSDDSQEVEYNEDNYRRYMELKDQPIEASSLPTNAFKPGTQKLDELPEASQKHLRNQLRQIIMEAAEWAPGDENNKYPYVASEAAQQDPGLKQQEAEAWGELVGKYQEREAQIYANSFRSRSASGGEAGAQATSQAQAAAQAQATSQAQANGAESAAGSDAGDDAGQKGAGQKGAGEEQKKPGQENQSASNASDDNKSSSSASATASVDDPDSVSTSGVSQSALQYLMSNRQAGSNKTASDSQATESPSAAAREPGQLVIMSKDTLSVKDLQNAQGVSISTGAGATPGERPHKDEDD